MKLVYPAILIPDIDNSGYTVEVPDLPGCVSEGDNLAEAIEMGTDAACGWILGEIEDGQSYPEPSDISSIHSTDGIVTMLVLDIDAYSEKYGRKAVRKNVTIPAWLDTFAQKNNVSLSKVLQDALIKMASN